jgi:hypothetical protein
MDRAALLPQLPRRGFVSLRETALKFLLFSFCSFGKKGSHMGRGNMSRPLDRQTAAILVVGWLVALVTTLT